MHARNAAKSLLLAALCAVAIASCSGRRELATNAGTTATNANAAPTTTTVTEEELVTYLDWVADLRKQQNEALNAARRDMDDRDAYLASFERSRREQTAIFAREPLKGTRQREAINAVLDALYGTGPYVRDEEKLEKARERYGKELIDAVLARESLIRDRLGS